jgi:hypothetical protein
MCEGVVGLRGVLRGRVVNAFCVGVVVGRSWAVGVCLLAGGLLFGLHPVVAGAVGSAGGPAWSVSVVAEPGVFRAGGEGLYAVTAVNTGGGSADGGVSPVVLRDVLPVGVTATGVEGLDTGAVVSAAHLPCDLGSVSCVMGGVVTPGAVLVMKVSVSIGGGFSSVVNSASVSGGGALGVSAQDTTGVGGEPLPFGVAPGSFLFVPSTAQAGGHPNLTTSFMFNASGVEEVERKMRDLGVDLPAGFTGNPLAVPECDMARVENNTCPPDSAVGVPPVPICGGATRPVLVYNIVPYADEPAAFAFSVTFPVRLDTSLVRDQDGEYHIRASINDATEATAINGATVTLWGVPADHNGPGPNTTFDTGFGTSTFGGLGGGLRTPFFTNPTACAGPLTAGASLLSWPTISEATGATIPPGQVSVAASVAGLSGCEGLVFNPTLTVAPDSTQAGAPTGLGVDVHIPQNENAEALATPALKDALVTLPPGVVVSPSAADGLAACSEVQVDLQSLTPAGCPDASKVGTVEVQTPLLAKPLQGSLYLASQEANPFHSLLAMYLVAEGNGIVIKLPGEVHADLVTGQLTTSFLKAPEQPVSDIRLHLNGGPRAPLANPTTCAPATSTSQLTPWSGGAPATPSSSYQPSGCAPPQFSPSFIAGTTNNQAGAFSPFSVTLSRTDQDEALSGVSVTTPPGLLGILKSVTQCPEAQASQGACPPQSLIGHTTVGAGPGPTPFYIDGQVFLTGPYNGAPFGLSILVPAIAGPFNLGNVNVRAAINVDPATAQLKITTNPLPTILQGIPIQVKTINVTIDRPNFMFNPTSCEPLNVTATLASTHGATAHLSSRFQAANCQSLPFKINLTASTQAKTSRKEGASLHIKFAYPPTPQSNIHTVFVTLPKQLPARLSTIQQACPDTTFNTNPATCPTGSLIGAATATTPILTSPVTGPVYLVSHGGAAFPDIIIVLQGEGIRLDLTGNINITKNGITTSTFNTIPDTPINTFELTLPEGPHSGLTATTNLCNTPLHLPTTITSQNNTQTTQNPTIKTTNCPHKHNTTKNKKTKNKKTK